MTDKLIEYASLLDDIKAHIRRLLASGCTDIAIDAGYDPFDVFAPIAVIEGAGGIVSDWSGNAIGRHWRGQVLAAGSTEIHQQAMAVLADV